MNGKVNGQTGKGTFTIMEVKTVDGADLRVELDGAGFQILPIVRSVKL